MTSDTPDIPDIDVRPARRSFWQRASVVWVVPIVALVIALGVAWQTWSSQGPVIVVSFDEALGVRARETELRYRDVTIGRVEEVGFSADIGRVEVTIRVDKSVAPYIDDDAVFWVVRPEVSARGVTGLDTVLSGVFIEGVWDTQPETFVDRHEGLDTAPLLRPGERGTTITLVALPGTALSEGTAITHKGIEVGRIGKPQIRVGAARATAPAVVYAPYDRLLSSTTRFWDTSGFTFTLGTGGANLDFTSFASLIAGGISFDSIVSGGLPLRGTPRFEVYESEQAARVALFEDRRGSEVSLSILFEENAPGLAVGAPVQFNGIEIGEVTAVSGVVDPLRFRDQRVRLQVVIEVSATPLGLDESAREPEVIDFFATQVAAGLRARLATASILTGGLRVDLVTLDDAAPDVLDRSALPFPAIPTTESEIADAGATAQGVLTRIDNLPIEEVMEAAIEFLNASTALVSNGDLSQIPGDVRGILTDVRTLTASEDVQGLPARVTALLDDVRATTADLQGILAAFERAKGIERLLAAIDAAQAAADTATASIAGVPDLIESLTATADTARQLPLNDLVTQATQVLDSADAFLTAPGAEDLPASLRDALDEMRLALSELREGGAVANLNATLGSAEEAATAIAAAAEQLPDIAARLNATLDTAAATLEGFEENSDFNRTARQALTEVARAARAVESLARTIERQPNSILLGR